MQIGPNGFHESAEGILSANHYFPADDVHAGNGMDIDEVEAPATPSPEPVPTLANGSSVGIQSEKSVDVSDRTSILALSSPSQTLMHIAWNPQHPTVFATAGEALCRIWNVSKEGSASEEPYHDLLPSSSEDSLTSTMAWSPDGEVLAVASRSMQSSDWIGSVILWTKHGKVVEEFSATQEMVILLRWNDKGTRLLGITSSGERSSSVVVWDLRTPAAYPPCQIDGELRDGAWIDDTRFVVCGRGIIATSYYPSPLAVALDIHQEKAVSARTWVHVRHDPHTDCTICAAEEESLLVISGLAHGSPDTKLRHDAHSDQITALELSAAPVDHQGRVIASASLDLSVKIWSTSDLTLLNTLTLGPSSPITALSFALDGHLLAAASQNRISVWNSREQGPPKVTWRGDLGRSEANGNNSRKSVGLVNGNSLIGANDHPAPDRDSAVGDLADEDGALGYSLSWSSDGQKLALGAANQVSILLTIFKWMTDGVPDRCCGDCRALKE